MSWSPELQRNRMPNYPLSAALRALAIALLLGAGGCATPSLDLPTPAALADLAPRGSLRVALILSSPAQVVKDSKTGDLQGPAIDLARSLANRLGVPLQTAEHARAEDIIASAKSGAWDIAFLPIEPARANDLDVSRPYLEAATVRQAIALPKGKPAGLAYVNQFIEQARTSGFVQRSIERAELKDVNVAR
jgi:ABC-type amino acid transport substrate-binding protein